MKKGTCFTMTAALCAMLFTACGNDSAQSGNTNAQSQSAESSAAQNLDSERQNHTTAADTTESVSEIADIAKSGQTEEKTGKVLVVYYSASGNTKAVAETIAEYTGGDTFEIIPVEQYTGEDLDWTQEGSRVNREHEDESLQDIELVSTTVEDFASYDTVFIGYPIWWHEAAWVVNNFVKGNDFTGKTVIPFCTSSSSGLGESGVHLAEMAGTGDWQEGIRFSGNAQADEVTQWLDGLDF